MNPGYLFNHDHERLEKMKPCPFCGCEDVVMKDRTSDCGIAVQCCNCGGRGPYWDDMEDKAIKSWNDRPDPLAEHRNTLERLKDR